MQTHVDYIIRATGTTEDKAAILRRAARLAEHDRPDGAVVYVPLTERYAVERAMPGYHRAMRQLRQVEE